MTPFLPLTNPLTNQYNRTIMRSMYLFNKILILLVGVAISVYAVPPVLNYAGQVAVNGEAFDGNGLFKFALVNADGTTTYWSNDGTSVNGSEPQASVAVPVNGGLYSILLGNTALQGMGAIDPAVFAQHGDAKLRVWFSDGVNGFQQLSPDRPFASVPYAFSAGVAQTAGSAPIANGAVNLDMLSEEVKGQINAPISLSRLSEEVVADINATIGMNRLSTEVTEKLNQEKTTNNYNAPSVGSLLAVPYGSDAPAGYSLYQQSDKTWNWKEVLPHLGATQYIHDGVVYFNNEIYIAGGWTDTSINKLQKFNPSTNNWQYLANLNFPRERVASTVLNGKIYVIGGKNGSNIYKSVEIYDPESDTWTIGTPLPFGIHHSTAETKDGKIYLLGGVNSSGQSLNKVMSFDPNNNEWNFETNMTIPISQGVSCIFDNRIWIAKNHDVLSYDTLTKTWKTERSFTFKRNLPIIWTYKNKIYVAGGSSRDDIVVLSDNNDAWNKIGELPNKYLGAKADVLGDKLFLVAGRVGSPGALFNTDAVFFVNLDAPTEGVYDLYRKDGDAPVGTPVVQSEYADGSVIGSKMADGAVTASKIASNAITTNELNEQILKYLKPEIITQPQAQAVYADTNATFSVTAEGKYLTYQWKKDGSDLTGETNATLTITDANATQHDGDYSVVVSNDFGSVESEGVEIRVSSLNDGLLAWWPFDGNGLDMSENGRHSTPTNTFSYTSGKINQAIRIVGLNGNTGGHILIPYISNIEGSDFSITLWVKEEQMHYSHGQYYIQLGGFASFGNTQGYTFGNSTDSTIQRNQWNHIAFVFGSSTKIGFLNGAIALSSSWNRPTSSSFTNSAIGKHWWENGQESATRLTGQFDDVRIYDRALSAEEVQALYNMGQ